MKKKALKLQKGNRQIHGHYSKKHIKTQLFNILKGKCSISPVTKESHIKTRVKYHFGPTKFQIYFKMRNQS